MHLPKEIKGINKVRDAKILQLFLRENLTLEEIGSRFDLTASRVQQILYTNRHLITWDKGYEKAMRVNALKRLHNTHRRTVGNKSAIDILEQIRKELEGDKSLVNVEQHRSFIVVRPTDKKADESRIKDIPG